MVSRRVRPIAKEEVETRSRERVSELPREVRDVTIFSALKSAGTAFASGRDWFARDSQCVVFFSSSFGYAAASVARGPFPVEIARSLARSLARALARLGHADRGSLNVTFITSCPVNHDRPSLF